MNTYKYSIGCMKFNKSNNNMTKRFTIAMFIENAITYQIN